MFLGRLAREKRVELAREIARRATLPLKIAAKVAESTRTEPPKNMRRERGKTRRGA